ncbi:MAG: efflux RND transporter periplasmic adaptor subunit [Chloroflexi bacterium]|nr:efflux RND transporter periplasmic adaptor subunit [Chloroflexota bacterium]
MNASLASRPVRLGLAALIIVGVIAGGVALVQRATGGEPTAAPPAAAVPVQVTAAKAGEIRTVLTYSGAIQSSQQVSLAPRLAGQLASVQAEVGMVVKQGDVLATLDAGTLPAQLQQAQASLSSALARLQLMLDGPRAADVAAAEASLAAAEARLKQLLNPSPADLSAAESALRTAEVGLNNAKVTVGTTKNGLSASLSSYCNVYNAVHVKCESPLPIPQENLAALQEHIASNSLYALSIGGTSGTALITANNTYLTALNNLNSAEVAFAAAQDRYGQVRLPSTTDVTAQRSAVAAARAVLDNRRIPYTDADIAGTRAAVAAAQASVATARTNLEQTSVVAPFDGLIAQKLLAVGATVSPQTPIFVLVTKAVESRLTVDEARIGLIKRDMPVELSVPAYPDRVFKGRVVTIAPLGDARAHTFDVTVFAEDRDGLLKPGMFAQVNVIAATKANAVLVPTSAIVQQGPTARVFVIANRKASTRTVKIGIADAANTEIVEGVSAGDQVVTVGQNILRDGQTVAISTAGTGGGRPAATGTAPGAATAATGTP